jgi:hypothetical protein
LALSLPVLVGQEVTYFIAIKPHEKEPARPGKNMSALIFGVRRV